MTAGVVGVGDQLRAGLARLLELGQVSSGDAVLLAGFGAGLTAAAQVITLP